MNMADGQHLNIAMISASVLLAILRVLKRWLHKDGPLRERYDIDGIESPPKITS
jgi:hypothetical protein